MIVSNNLDSIKLNQEIKQQWQPELLNNIKIIEFTGNEELLSKAPLIIRVSQLVDEHTEDITQTAKVLIGNLLLELIKLAKDKKIFNSCIVVESIVASMFDSNISSNGIFGPFGYYTGQRKADAF